MMHGCYRLRCLIHATRPCLDTRQVDGKSGHIPYRDLKLTRLLQVESLWGGT